MAQHPGIAIFHAESNTLGSGRFHQQEEFGVRVIDLHPVYGRPLNRIQVLFRQAATEFFGTGHLQIPDVVGDANFGGVQSFDQPLPLGHHIFHAPTSPGVAGDRFRAEGAFVGATPAGEDGERTGVGVQAIGEGLEVGVLVDFEEIVGGEG